MTAYERDSIDLREMCMEEAVRLFEENGKLCARIHALETVRNAAKKLTDECQGGRYPPTLGTLCELEFALSVEARVKAG